MVRGHYMCKQMPVIPVNRVVDKKKNNQKKWRPEDEELHKWSLTTKKHKNIGPR
jgi:hypothetical protein